MSVCVCKRPFKVFAQVRLLSHGRLFTRTRFEPEVMVYDIFRWNLSVENMWLVCFLFFSCTTRSFCCRSFHSITVEPLFNRHPNGRSLRTGHCGEVAIFGTNLPNGTKICVRCRDVAVVTKWLLLEVRLYSFLLFYKRNSTTTNHGICLGDLPALINRLQPSILIVSFSLHKVNLETQSLTKTCWRTLAQVPLTMWRRAICKYPQKKVRVTLMYSFAVTPLLFILSGLGKESVWSFSLRLFLPETFETWNSKRSLSNRSGMSKLAMICEYYELMSAF